VGSGAISSVAAAASGVSLGSFHEAQLAEIAGKRRLRDPDAEVAEAASQFVLAAHGLTREEL